MSAEPEVAEAFADMWADIVMPGGEWDHDQVMRELYDYKMLLDNVPKVYDHVTQGRISKPNTLAYEVIGQADEVAENDRKLFLHADLMPLIDEMDDGVSPECSYFAAQLREAIA